MSRNLYCPKCGERSLQPMHPEDAAMGFHRRRVHLKAKKPAEHFMEIIDDTGTKRQYLAALACDGCGVYIPDGSDAVAVTMWRGDNEIGAWEQEYGTLDYAPGFVHYVE